MKDIKIVLTKEDLVAIAHGKTVLPKTKMENQISVSLEPEAVQDIQAFSKMTDIICAAIELKYDRDDFPSANSFANSEIH